MSFDDLGRFEISIPNQTITAFDVGSDVTDETLNHLLNDHVAPRILAGNGYLVLHGSAVEINGELAVFLGDTGAGKSTMAASLDSVGHTLLGDDAVVITEEGDRIFGEPVYPSLRLYPETASAIFGADIQVAPMAHYSDKKQIGLASLDSVSQSPIPIGALFYLTGEPDGEEVEAHALHPSDVCISLIEQSFALEPRDASSAAARLRMASDLAGRIPGYELSYPHDLDRLDDVNAMIVRCMDAAKTIANPS